MTRVLVLIPTYNEAENIRSAVTSIRSFMPKADILVIDDASPDGTGDIADAVADADPRVHVLHRGTKDGLGAAYLAGFEWGLARKFDVLVEFDADGSHPASVIEGLVEAVSRKDIGLAIGSRWTTGGSVVDWPWHRKILSRGGNSYARAMLNLTVRDSTAGFRAYRSSTLRALDLKDVKTRGYGFQVDMTRRTRDAGIGITEIPITFRERTRGESKMSGAIVLEAMWSVTRWGVSRLVSQFRRAASRR